MKRAASVLLIVLAACGGPRDFTREELPDLVLQPSDAPKNTAPLATSSGFQELDSVGEDEAERKAYTDAGFRAAYYQYFQTPDLFKPDGTLDPAGSLAFSFAILFGTRDGARRGFDVLEQDVRRDGRNLAEKRPPGFGEESFALEGTLEEKRPPGFIFAWRERNAVFGLVAGGAPGVVKESAARALVERMAARVD